MRANILTGVLAAFTIAAPQASADQWNKLTRLDIDETIQVPGATLTPGKYVVKLADSPSNRHIVRFFNEDQTKVLATVLAVPNQRMEPTGDTQLAFYETPAGEPPALRAWFYPGDTFGQQFVYADEQARQIAGKSKRSVPAMASDAAKRLNTGANATSDPPALDPKTRVYSRSPDNREGTLDEGFTANQTLDKDANWRTKQKSYSRYGRFGSMEEGTRAREKK